MKLNKISFKNQDITQEGDLYDALAQLKNAEEAKLFLKDLCTPTEIQAMMDRWSIVPLIKAGKSYRQIHQDTKVSVTTIGRVARFLLLGEGGYHLIYERLNKKNQKSKRK